jgi:branched-chain amino acid aminotransferase
MILLNQWGRVAEATGACLVMIRNGCVITPPASEGRLESITLEIVGDICRSLNMEFIQRPIDRTELYIAEELFLVGTLAEIVSIKDIDGYELSVESPMSKKIADTFWAAARGVKSHPAIDLSMVKLPKTDHE